MKTEPNRFEIGLMKIENIVGFSSIAMTSYLAKRAFDRGVLTSEMCLLAAIPVVGHILMYGIIKLSYDINTKKNEEDAFKNQTIFNILAMPFIGPFIGPFRYNRPKKS